MLMFLSILCMSLLGVAVCAAAFSLATAGVRTPEPRPERRPAVEPPQFFAQSAARPRPERQVPLEMLLGDIERHIRLEQAAAEAFLAGPTLDGLHEPPVRPRAN
ncbi:MAG TPA: hypothetical protein VEQ10_11420 [Vicinamibacteria bacterium]|nr:hypothetical protein [Vicinamibacteria bacterium]